MLTETQLERYAEVLLWGLKTGRKTSYRKQDIIYIQYDPAAVRLAEILFDRVLERGMNPVQRMGLTVPMEKRFFAKADHRQLVFQTPGDKELCEKINGRIYLHAPERLTHLKDVDPCRIGRYILSRKPMRNILDRREQEGAYSWTLCTLPTTEMARQAGMGLRAYTNQVVRACFLDREDSLAAWTEIHRQVTEIKAWLRGLPIRRLQVETASMDLEVTLGARRKWVGLSGHNIPSFEIFVSPDWRGTRGSYYANLPSYRSGNFVEGVRLTFEKGNAVEVQADQGEPFATKQIAMDTGASRVGEFSLTDRRFSRICRFMADTLFDENHGGKYGNCHVAVGASYADCYDGDPATLTRAKKQRLGFNDSALHWDLINTEDKTVTAHLASGERLVIYDGGLFRC